jgi:thiol-disulfide isomerase/thioredoxin
MLSHYGIENTGVKINNKQDNLGLLDPPFIANYENNFIVVNRISGKTVDYIQEGKNISIPKDEFVEAWSGIALFAEPDENSVEPGYKMNKKREIYRLLGKLSLLFLTVVLVVLPCVSQQLIHNMGFLFLLLFNLTGVYVCYLLALKQVHIQSSSVDKICSLLKQGNCNDILESDAAKLGGIIGWSEIGLGYFIFNLVVLLFLPHLIFYSALINLYTLPYTIWSVWYQKVKAKHWCALCLIVQILLWVIFIIDTIWGYIQMPLFNLTDLFWISVVYGIPFLAVSLLISKLSQGNREEKLVREINILKSDETVFFVLLKKQSHYEVSRDNSTILFGNPDSSVFITVLTNPHCDPCARMHGRIEKLLKETPDKFCVQYIFSSFGEKMESSSHFLIDIYRNHTIEQTMDIYNEWFKSGKYRKEEMFEKYGFDLEANNPEYLLHKRWRQEQKLSATPVLLINGYQFPGNYKIEDLKHMSFEVNIK